MRKTWKVINEATDSDKKKKTFNCDILDGTGELVDKDNTKCVANTFNKYSINIGLKLASNMRQTSDRDLEYERNDKTIFITPVTENEVNYIIGQQKSNSSPGPDGLQSYILKHIKRTVLLPLTHIINLCFSTGKFPNGFERKHCNTDT